ncbi:DUF977 family protein [Enterobacter asburiae]|uniref:DUF977 family protein n=1 Tax=Enterobacter asburiae TaxID=61645 RepID=UPI00200567D8|nr:DUF977 family protein [Enterobacter asburiae]MCK7419833.1 DUF977 family protein [Enterobacter asburiae]
MLKPKTHDERSRIIELVKECGRITRKNVVAMFDKHHRDHTAGITFNSCSQRCCGHCPIITQLLSYDIGINGCHIPNSQMFSPILLNF